MPELEEISAIDLVRHKMEICKPVYIYHCFKTIYPNEVKSHTEQYVEKTKKHDYTKEHAVILLAEALIDKHGETKIIKIMDKHFPNIDKITIHKNKEDDEKEKIIDKTINEGVTKQINEKKKLKYQVTDHNVKIGKINEALNDFMKTKEITEETIVESKIIEHYWHDIQLSHQILEEENEQYKEIIIALENKKTLENLDIITTGNEIWRMKSENLREKNNKLLQNKLEQLSTTFADEHEILETKFNKQILMINEMRVKQEQGERLIIDLKKKLIKKVDKEELDEMEEKLITNTGKMELYKKQAEIKEKEIQQYIAEMKKFKVFEDPTTPEIEREKRKVQLALKLEELRKGIEEMPLTPINREQTVEINTETFTPKVTSTKDIKTKLFDSKFKNESTNEPQSRQSKNTISKFNGEGAPGTAFDSWIKVFEKNANYGKWSIDRKITELPIYLEKTAADFYDQLSNLDKEDLETIKRKFKQRFDLIETPEVCISRLMLAKKKRDEGSRAFGQRIQMLYDKAYPSNDKKEWREEYKNVQLTQLFINGMNKDMILY